MEPEVPNIILPEPIPPPKKINKMLIGLLVLIIIAGVASWIFLFTKPQIKSDSQLVTTATTTDQFKDWKTYTNAEYGFEFKYPKDIYVELTPTKVVSIIHLEDRGRDNDTHSGIWIYTKNNPENLNPTAWADKYGDDKGSTIKLERTETTIGSLRALEIYGSEGILYNSILISHNGKMFNFLVIGGLRNMNQILSTFKFTKPTTSSVRSESQIELQIRNVVEATVLKDKYRNLENLRKIKLLSVKVDGRIITLNYNEEFFYVPEYFYA